MSVSDMDPEATIASGREIKVWDPIVRLFHWTVVTGCILNLTLFEDGKQVHRAIGYAVAAALFIRLVWGLIGTRHARFSDFVPKPMTLVRYVKALLTGEEPRYIGHNPAGALMMIALMGLLAGVSLTGWMMTLDAFFGDDTLQEVHEMFANAILLMAGLHAAAALFESWRHRENLVWSMVTGRKRA